MGLCVTVQILPLRKRAGIAYSHPKWLTLCFTRMHGSTRRIVLSLSGSVRILHHLSDENNLIANHLQYLPETRGERVVT